jgi:hypothetical protein
MIVQLSRDPFARTTLLRDTVEESSREPCQWCGSRPGRFQYGVEHDSGRTYWDYRCFCCKSCWESFHGR